MDQDRGANEERGHAAHTLGNWSTAGSNWLRALNYNRTAAIFLEPDDARRGLILHQMRACSALYLNCLAVGETVQAPLPNGRFIDAYFLPGPDPDRRR